VSLFFNVRAFYIIALIAMAGGIAGGAIFAGLTPGGSSTQPTITPTATATEQPEEPTSEPATPQARIYPNAPDMTIDTDKQYFALIETKKGDIRLELFADEAPQTVNNFVFLARDGFYDGLTFHFVDPELWAQAGDPECRASGEVTCRSEGGPGYTLPAETNDREHVAGSVAMAEDVETYVTNGSQFFIALEDLPRLGDHNTVFGQVADEESMAVVRSLTPRDWRDREAPPGDEILSVTIEEGEETPTPTE
jgi:cyclophilin family peptidyl-prolyl cis-trans isomerase